MAHRIVSLLVVVFIAASAAAAPPDEAAGVLKQFLGLSDEQIQALGQLAEARRQAIEPLQRQIAGHEENYRRGFQELLTPAQRAQVDAIRGIEAALHVAQALHLLGL